MHVPGNEPGLLSRPVARLLCCAIALLLGVAEARAVIVTSIGKLTPTVTLGAEYDTNVYGNGLNEQASWIYRVSPSILFERTAGAVKMTGQLGCTKEIFAEASALGGINPQANLGFSYPAGLYQSSLNLSYAENADEDPLRATRVRQRTYGGDFLLRRRLSGKWGLGLVGNWSRTQDLGATAAGSQDTWQVGPRLTYDFNRFLTFYSGYRLRSSQTRVPTSTRKLDTDTSGFDLGVDGRLPIRLLPGVQVSASGGYQVRSSGGARSRGGLVGDVTLDYEVSERTLISLTGGQDFVTSLNGDQGQTTHASASVRHAFTPRISAGTGVNWSHTKFDGGTSAGESQNGLGGFIDGSYSLVRYASLRARYQVSRSLSDTARRDFLRERILIELRLTY